VASADVFQHLRLPVAESGLALVLEDQVHAGPGARDDLRVEIDERQAVASRQAPANAALARRHRADQEQVWRRIHAPGC